MTSSPSVLVVQHEDACPPDRLGAWLATAGVELVLCRPYLGDTVPAELDQDGLLVLGGHVGAYDDDQAPWLPATRDLLATAVGTAAPTLGVCLGAQLLAVACGGRVEVGRDGIEAGVVDVRWRPEAQPDPLFGGVGASTPGPSMHLDAVVELPPAATWLGDTRRYPHQAFRVGPAAWGVQFHPEASPATYRRWATGHEADWPRWGIDGDDVVAQLDRRDTEVAAAGERLAVRFARVLAAAPAGRYRR